MRRTSTPASQITHDTGPTTRGATNADRVATCPLITPTFSIGDRVVLSKFGVWSLIAWPVRGALPDGGTRRSCYRRRLTDMSVGTVVGYSRLFSRCVIIKWDEIKERRSVSAEFLSALHPVHPAW